MRHQTCLDLLAYRRGLCTIKTGFILQLKTSSSLETKHLINQAPKTACLDLRWYVKSQGHTNLHNHLLRARFKPLWGPKQYFILGPFSAANTIYD